MKKKSHQKNRQLDFRPLKTYAVITLGVILVAWGLDLFLVPNRIAAGGVSGLATILHYLLHVPVGATMLVLNALLFLIAVRILGLGFGIKSFYATAALSVFVDLFSRFLPPNGLTNDLMLAVLFGDFLTGTGMALVFSTDASTGGTDIIAMILKKLTDLDVPKGLLLIDFTITLFAAASFGITIGMYSLLAVIVNSFTIDSVLTGVAISTQVIIISMHGKKIAQRIIKEVNRGVTFLKGQGAYSGKDIDVVLTVLRRRRELARVKSIVREEDPKAFMMVSHVHEVFGEGFKNID